MTEMHRIGDYSVLPPLLLPPPAGGAGGVFGLLQHLQQPPAIFDCSKTLRSTFCIFCYLLKKL
ncbi:hypothetical protein [Paraburkholderia piptadeniae]|nr:hypothetical protein [Paraburkholderia piptadeniae]